MPRNRRVLKREVLFIQVQLSSPLSVSSGDGEWTDSDVLRDPEGNPFVAGSSLAGAMRAYIEKKKTEDCIFGFSRNDSNGNDTGRMSSVFISDLTFEGEVSFGTRDGVSLNDNKTAEDGSKFDMEIIESCEKAHFFMELTIREADDETEMHREISEIIHGINNGEIRLGSKKTRGFGEFKVLEIRSRLYDSSNYLDYAEAYYADDDKKPWWEEGENCLAAWMSYANDASKMIHIEVPLRMRGGISIRRYAAKKGEPDFTTVTGRNSEAGSQQSADRDIPVIPGSSMAGALRHRVKEILAELKEAGAELPGEIDKYVDIAFGYVHGNKACSSNIIIGETEIKNARPLTMVRTGVSRFESAVKQGALYKERTYVDGTFTLKIMIRKGSNPADEKWILGLLLLAVKDLQNGLLAVGGQTAIGRGICEANGSIRIDGEQGTEDDYIRNIYRNMTAEGGSC